jgi:hypothetical protein
MKFGLMSQLLYAPGVKGAETSHLLTVASAITFETKCSVSSTYQIQGASDVQLAEVAMILRPH